MFHDKLCVSSFLDRFQHYVWTAAASAHPTSLGQGCICDRIATELGNQRQLAIRGIAKVSHDPLICYKQIDLHMARFLFAKGAVEASCGEHS